MSNFSNSITMSRFRFTGLYANPRTITLEDSVRTNEPKNNKLRVVTLFSGYGSQELALKYIGVDHTVVGHSDILKTANKVFDVLHSTEMGNLGDITKVDEKTFPKCDLLTYSSPCQDLSLAGKQQGIKEGTRSGLLYEVERIIKAVKPKFLMFENVKNLVSKRHMPSFQKHIDFLKGLGYGCFWRVLNAADFGCAQNRERVIMMAVQGETNEQVKAKMLGVEKHKQQRTSMRPFIETGVNENLFINCEYVAHTGSQSASVCKQVAKRTDVKYDQAQRIYSIDGCSPCLTKSAIPQIMTQDGRVRYISAREGYRFMGIQEDDINEMLNTSLSEKQHLSLAGNSICVPVLEAVFTTFFKKVEVKNYLWEGLRRVA
jgi:DNA-cytosine methyltransferase